MWVRLVRSANTIAASYSADGTAWTALATVPATLPTSVVVGLPLTSHDNTQTATATLDHVSVSSP
jgi:regulation of enolase protein 1 (concanavalin A-like superfamily)